MYEDKNILSEEDLNAATGGRNTYGNAVKDTTCWFRPTGAYNTATGREKCKTDCEGKFDSKGNPVYPLAGDSQGDPKSWKHCKCRGTLECVDRWHLECGNPKRTNW